MSCSVFLWNCFKLVYVFDHNVVSAFCIRNTDEYYIGYKVVNNQLVRLDNAIQSWAPWKVGEPSGSGDCVSSFNTDGTFWDERCTAEYGAICQYPSFSSRLCYKHHTTYTMEMETL